MEITTLKQLRLQSNTKQEVIALTMNVSKSAVSKIESKKMTSLPIDKLGKYIESVRGQIKVDITLPNGESVTI
jgi:transcriptional regulator with XRE-family HTH domain